MTAPNGPTRAVVAWARRDRLAKRMRATAATLSALAKAANQTANQVETGQLPAGATHIDLVAGLQQAILAGVADLHLDSLTRSAADADIHEGDQP